MVWSYSLFLAKQIITPYHAAQKAITKDQHALEIVSKSDGNKFITGTTPPVCSFGFQVKYIIVHQNQSPLICHRGGSFKSFFVKELSINTECD
ncbi:hypothetical protein D5E85_07790 [Vibrio parahaemolyticus]|nr:hypothetical protein D5E85_07790 [Vibrio parahaemolyticus]